MKDFIEWVQLNPPWANWLMVLVTAYACDQLLKQLPWVHDYPKLRPVHVMSLGAIVIIKVTGMKGVICRRDLKTIPARVRVQYQDRLYKESTLNTHEGWFYEYELVEQPTTVNI